MAQEVMDFDVTTRKEVSVKFENKMYVLVEASGDAAVKYRNKIVQAAKMESGRVTSVQGIVDSEPFLVSLCLFQIVKNAKGDESRVPVPESTIRSWPGRIQRALYDKAREISELDEAAEDEKGLEKKIKDLQSKLAEVRKGDPAKNAPPGSTADTSE